MAIESTETLSPLYLLDPPDWNRGVELERIYRTNIETSRAGIEQRTSLWPFARFKMSFVISALNGAEFQIRRLRAEAEVKSPLLVPIWPLRYSADSVAGTQLTLDEDGEHDLHPRQWVYVVQGATTSVIPIQDVNGKVVTAAGGSSFGAFSAGATVYPVRECVRTQPDPIFQPSHVRGIDEHVTVETL